jgi:hypothetical protein
MSLPKQKQTATAASNFAEVRKEIESDRLHPWSSAPTFTIGDFEVGPLTLRSQCDLTLCGCAIVAGAEITEGDLAVYIWRHHADFGNEKKRKKFEKALGASTDRERLVDDCFEHYMAAFEDTPNGAGFGGTHHNSTLPAIPSIAHLCDEYGSAYGIDPREVADIDLRIVFQACRAIRIRGGDTKYLEPKKLREAKSEFIKQHG